MLGMLVLAIDRPARCCCAPPTSPPRCRSRASSAPTGSSPPSCRRSGRTPGQALSAANLTAVLAGLRRGRLPPRTGLQPGAGRLLAALLAAGARRRPRHRRARRAPSPAASWPVAVDNPVVLAEEGRVESNGNFHGAPVAYVLDFLAIVAADVASISERRTDRFLDKARNHGLPPFLADDPGVDSGHMIAQYTQAAIVSELKRLAVPGVSVDSIPSSAMQEDHVSMGWSAARKLRRSVDGLTRVVAIEVLTAARALDLRRAAASRRPATGAVVACCAPHGVEGPGPDRHLSPEIETAVELVRVGRRPARRRRSDRRTRMTDDRQPPPAHPRRPRHRADRASRGRPRRRCGC